MSHDRLHKRPTVELVPSPTAVVLAPCPFDSDPRHGYWRDSLAARGHRVLEIEILTTPRHWRHETELISTKDRISLFSSRPPRLRHSILDLLHQCSPETSTGAYVGGQANRCISALELLDSRLREIELVVANDLLGAIAALTYWEPSKILYDAQEMFTDMYDVIFGESLSAREKSIWIDLETEVIREVKQVVTVSPGIGRIYEQRHGSEPAVIPNFVPQAKFVEPQTPKTEPNRSVRFVFIGRADPNRGLEELIREWDFPEHMATLDLIVPPSPLRAKLKKIDAAIKRLGSGPVFLDGVSPAAMIATLSAYDVGILPYNYPPPYDQASPNKFGEYVAAGLAVIANEQPFVASVINELEIGTIFSWASPRSFKQAVQLLTTQGHLDVARERVRIIRNQELSWDECFINLTKVTDLGPRGESGQRATEDRRFASVEATDFTITRAVIQRLRSKIMSFVGQRAQRLQPIIRLLGRVSLVRRMIK